MTSAAQLAAERFPDTTLPSVLPLPSPPLTPEDCVRYLRQLHVILNMNQTRLAEIMRIISYHRSTVSTDEDTGLGGTGTGGTEAMPPASGSGVEHAVVDRTTGQARLFVDTFDENGDPYWYEVGAGPCMTRTTGFANQTDSELSWSDVNRRLTITPGEGGYDFWVMGVKFHKDEVLTVDITDVEGLHYIYFDNTGTLTHSIAASLYNILFENAIVAIIHWDADNNKAIYVGDERHGLMDPDVHYWIHSYGGGTQHGSGLTLGDILADESGADNTHAEMSVSSGSIVDEDFVHVLEGQAAPANIPVLYKSGATPVWRLDTATNAPIKLSGGVPQINTYSAPNWGQTAVSNTKFFLMHIFATNDFDAARQIVAIQGEAEYATINEAQDGALVEISAIYTDGLPMPEFLPLGTVIYQYNTAYANDYDCRIRATDAGDDYVNWLTNELTPGSAPSSHALLTGRDLPNQHPADAVQADVTNFNGHLSGADTDVQAALDTIDDHDHDDEYISVIAAPAANHFPYQTAGGELIDSGYDAADFSAAGHDHDADYLPLAGGTLTGDLKIGNTHTKKLKFYTGAADVDAMWYSNSGYLVVGDASQDLTVLASRLLTLPPYRNNQWFTWEDSGGGVKWFTKLDASDRWIMASDADIYFGDLAGGNYTKVEYADGDIRQFGNAVIDTERTVTADDGVLVPLVEATQYKALANNVGGNFFKWGSGAAAGSTNHFIVHFSIQVQYTVIGTTYYWTRGGSISGTILKLAANLVKAIAGAVVWDGAGIAFNAAGGSNTPTMGESVTMGTTASAADIGPAFLVNLVGVGYAFVSGEVRYTVIATDRAHTGYSVFI